MSYSLIIDSKNRIAPTDSPNDAIYYFDWSAFQVGKYKVTWSIYRAPAVAVVGFEAAVAVALPVPIPDILWYKFEANDFRNLTIKNHATGDYLATCSTAGMSSSVTSATGTGSSLMNRTNWVTLNSTNTLLNAYSLTQSQTYSIWFCCTSVTPQSSGLMVPLIFAYKGMYEHTTFAIFNNGGNNLTIGRNNSGSQYFPMNTNTFAVNTWNHYPVTVENDSSNKWTYNAYLNGASVSGPVQNTNLSVNTGEQSYIGSGNITTGVNGYTGNANFIGYVDDLRVWNKVLTVQEIKNLYNKL